MILLIDTTDSGLGSTLLPELNARGCTECELIETRSLHISPCLGCNHCWLKTPGECVIRDDYTDILKRLKDARQTWLITDTSFGFVTSATKNLVDRVMPLVTMNLHFRHGEMRHVMRYRNHTDFGLIYTSDGDREYLDQWLRRVALNFEGSSLGVFSADEAKEALGCMC